MGNLYEDVEKFFGDIFDKVGRFVATYPIVFIVLTLTICFLLGLGLVNLRYETRVDHLYTPTGSQAFKDLAELNKLFPDQTSENFYTHQQLHFGSYGEIIITSKDEKSNVITRAAIREVWVLYETLLEMTLSSDGRGHDFHDLCAARGQTCVIDGDAFLRAAKAQWCLNPNISYPIVTSPTGETDDLQLVLSSDSVRQHGNCITAKAFRIKFNLRHDTEAQRELSIMWESRFLEVMQNTRLHSVKAYYRGSSSIDNVLYHHVSDDVKYFALTIIIMVIYATFVTAGGDCVTTRVLLAQAGVVGVLLAIMASFGLLSMCGFMFVDICGVVPFLVLGVGMDDMFILMAAWRVTDHRASIIDRTGETFRSAAISVSMTSLTDLLAFCIGATSPFLSVRNFCIYAAFSVLFCYINCLFFFGGIMVLNARRIEAVRHCVTCLPARSKAELEEEGAHKMYILACAGQVEHKLGENDSLCEKLPTLLLPKMLLQLPTKLAVVAVFVAYLVLSFWGASQIHTGLKLENIVPEESYLAQYLRAEESLYSHHGPYVMFVIHEPVYPINYFSQERQDEVTYLLGNISRSGYTDTSYEVSWLEAFNTYTRRNASIAVTQNNFLPILRDDFLPNNPQYQHDIKFNNDQTAIVACRIYVEALYFKDSTGDGAMMLVMRSLAANSSLPVTAYSPMFLFCEHYVSIMKNTLLAVGVAILGMLFVALAFIPHLVSIVMVIATMITIVIGMFSFMHFWGLALSAITSVQIILAVGFCVDFTMHICHAFMCATGMNKNERMVSALEFVGIPILNGAVSSILGILMLAFADSFIFRSFFKTMLLVIILGLGHALLLLPVALSVIGPGRTSKPRVFIPISPAARAGETMRPKLKRQNSGATVLSDDTGKGGSGMYAASTHEGICDLTGDLHGSITSIATDERSRLIPVQSDFHAVDGGCSIASSSSRQDDHSSRGSRTRSRPTSMHRPHLQQSQSIESQGSTSDHVDVDSEGKPQDLVSGKQKLLERMGSQDSDAGPRPPLITVSRDDILIEVDDEAQEKEHPVSRQRSVDGAGATPVVTTATVEAGSVRDVHMQEDMPDRTTSDDEAAHTSP